MEEIRRNVEIDDREKGQMLHARRMRSIDGVLEEVEVLIDTHSFNEFSKTKSSAFLTKVMASQNANDVKSFKKIWRSLNCAPKTMKDIREIHENLVCVGKRKGLIAKKNAETMCFYSNAELALNAKHTISSCKKVSAEINTHYDMVVILLLNNILKRRGLINHEPKWEDRKIVRTSHDEITVGTEHWRSEE